MAGQLGGVGKDVAAPVTLVQVGAPPRWWWRGGVGGAHVLGQVLQAEELGLAGATRPNLVLPMSL